MPAAPTKQELVGSVHVVREGMARVSRPPRFPVCRSWYCLLAAILGLKSFGLRHVFGHGQPERSSGLFAVGFGIDFVDLVASIVIGHDDHRLPELGFLQPRILLGDDDSVARLPLRLG